MRWLICFVSFWCIGLIVANHHHGGSGGGFAPSASEERSILHCIRGGAITAPEERRTCMRLLGAMREMREESGRDRHGRSLEGMMEKYHLDFNAMMLDKERVRYNGEKSHNTQREVMENVATCSRYSHSIRQEWNRFYMNRLTENNVRLVTIFPELHEVEGEVVEISFDPVTLANFSGHRLLAADLALQRAPPCEIDEYFGKYNVIVDQMLEDDASLELHRSEQASCPTTEGNMMVASFSGLGLMKEWLINGVEPLRLRVQVHPVLQIFADSTDPDGTESVLRNVLSLTFVLKQTPQSQPEDEPDLPGLSSLRPRTRSRRSPSILGHALSNQPLPRDCSRVSYTLIFSSPWQHSNVAFPSSIDAGECYARRTCDPDLTTMNSTTHAQILNVLSERRRNLHCSPRAWGDLTYSYYGRTNQLMTSTKEDISVTQCGCI